MRSSLEKVGAANSSAALSLKDSKTCDKRGDLPTLQHVVESIGTGPGQLLVAAVATGVFVADGAEVLLISSSSTAVAQEWNLGPLAQGSIVSFVFLGIMAGNFAGGPLGDWYGRRPPALMSYLGIFVFSITSSVSVNYTTLLCSRLLVGMSFGLGQPAVTALVNEISPKGTRSLLMGIGFMLFSCGEIYVAILLRLEDPSLNHLHWRRLLILGSFPAVFFGALAFFFLPESPMYNSMVGKMKEAQEMLVKLSTRNGRPDIPVAFREPEAQLELAHKVALHEELHILFHAPLVLTTLIMIESAFCVNLSYYGSMYAFPQILSHTDGSSTADELILGSLIELVGCVVATALCVMVPRIPAMKLSLGVQSLALAAFGLAAPRQNGTFLMSMVMYFGYYTVKFGTTIVFLVVYQYTAEVYPTKVRTSGSAVVMGSGRLSGIISPVLCEKVAHDFGHSAFFYLMSLFCFFSFLLIHLLPFETFGKQLNDNVEALVKDDEACLLGNQTASYCSMPRSSASLA